MEDKLKSNCYNNLFNNIQQQKILKTYSIFFGKMVMEINSETSTIQ